MDEEIKKQLDERNDRIIKAIIKKADMICKGAIALIGIAGSFQSGDIHEKSDLDLCIVINDESARKVGHCFIVDDVAFDIYCTPWTKLEEMAEYNSPYITKLLKLNIVYCSDEKYIGKYMELRAKVLDNLGQEFSPKDNEKAEEFVNEAIKEYANVILGDEIGECRYAAGGMLFYIEFALFMYNKTYIKKGVKRIPEEILKLEYLPRDFKRLYWEVIRADKNEMLKEASTALMKVVKDFSRQMKDRVVIKKEITEDDLRGTYEEVYSNWKNKMIYAANNDDLYLSLMTACSCQSFYDDMFENYNIERVNLMKDITPVDLRLSAEAFDNAMEEYKKNYDKLNMKIKYYRDLNEFEEAYLNI